MPRVCGIRCVDYLYHFNNKYFQMAELHIKVEIILSKVFYYKYCILKEKHLSKLPDHGRIPRSCLPVVQTTNGVQLPNAKNRSAIWLCIQDVAAYGSLQAGFDKATFKTWSNTPSIKLLALPRNPSFSPLLSMPLFPVLNRLSESYLFMYLSLQLNCESCNRRKYVRCIFVSLVPITELDK